MDLVTVQTEGVSHFNFFQVFTLKLELSIFGLW